MEPKPNTRQAAGQQAGSPPQEPEKKKAADSHFTTYLIIAACVVAGLIAGKIGFDRFGPQLINTARNAVSSSAKKVSQAKPGGKARSGARVTAKTRSSGKATSASADKAASGSSGGIRLAPLVRPAAGSEKSGSFALSGIFFDEKSGRGTAIVNDRVVEEGATVDGARVTRIERDAVELLYEGKTITLSN